MDGPADMELRQLIGEILKEELSDISIYIGEARLFAHKLVGGTGSQRSSLPSRTTSGTTPRR